jgi:hypothetical protein
MKTVVRVAAVEKAEVAQYHLFGVVAGLLVLRYP